MTDKKYDAGKLRMGLCLTQFANPLKGVARVLTYGAMKYPDPVSGDRSWRKVVNGIERYGDAFDRHMHEVRIDINDHVHGQPYAIDAETGQLHIDHAITNLLFLRTLLYGENIELDIIQPKPQASSVGEAPTQNPEEQEGIPLPCKY